MGDGDTLELRPPGMETRDGRGPSKARASVRRCGFVLLLALLTLGAGVSSASAAPPTVASITPNQGPAAGGTSVTIKGSGFVAGAKVKIGSPATAVAVVNETEITATTAATTPGSNEVVVEDTGGKSTSGVKYTYAAVPTVESITPNQGPIGGGQSVTIMGKGFVEGSTVKVTIGSEATAVTVKSEMEITATTAATAASSPKVFVTDAGGTNATGPTYTYVPAPTVMTEPATGPTQTSATLHAMVDPNGGEVSDCKFEYGPTKAYGSVAACSPPPGSGTLLVSVSGSAINLSPNTPYHFRIVATSPGGTGVGSDQTFVTPPNPPTVATEAASALTQTSATLTATINPNGGNVSECKFEYGPTEAYGSVAACSSSPGSGTSPTAVSASATGLSPNTPYHFRIVARNAGGPSNGSDQTVVTPPNPPAVVAEPTSALTQTSAMLTATVNPNGGNVSKCEFEYGPTMAYGSTVSCAALPGSGSSPVAVVANITGLAANTTYHFRVLATNAGGESEGADQTFTTPANTPTVPITVKETTTPIIVHVTPPNSAFKTLGAVFNPTSHMITFTESVAEPGTFSWLLTFQNGKFGVFGRTSAKCKNGFVKLGGKCRQSKIVFSRGSASITSAGTVTFALKPTASGMRALKNAYKQRKILPVAMTLTFQSVRSSSPVSRLLALTVRTR